MQRRSSNRHKIEPLNYAEAALSPALKGMTSFLDVSPENVRNQDFHSFGPTTELTAPEVQTSPTPETYPGDDTSPVAQTSKPHVPSRRPVTPITAKTPSAVKFSPRAITAPGHISPPPAGTVAGFISPAGNGVPPGDETCAGDISIAEYETPSRNSPSNLTPGRGRSKIRRCVLAQDGHSLGEEAIYQVLWRTGRAENGDPNGSRTNRMGAADIGFKVNMAKKNVRQNISRLFEKLAIEILEDFETINSQARLYRVYSYKQILERRRAAGLEYVLRNKGVVFCTQDGAELVSSPAYVSSPGVQTSIKPAPPKKRRNSPVPEPPRYPHTPSAAPQDGASDDADLQVVSQALNRYWTVDEAAAMQLLRDCRRARKDARADEIAFFVQEKLELSRNSRSITNPTGLILATVPQSFVGSAFEEFRRRMERHAKLEAEEAERKRQQEAELTAWIEKDRERYEAIVSDPTRSDTERDAAEKRLREISSWNS
jgi:hypothetical protein